MEQVKEVDSGLWMILGNDTDDIVPVHEKALQELYEEGDISIREAYEMVAKLYYLYEAQADRMEDANTALMGIREDAR